MNPNRIYFTAAWLLIAIAWLLAEGIAVGDPGLGDTFTEHLRPIIQAHPVITAVAAAFWAWLGYHFFIDKGDSS